MKKTTISSLEKKLDEIFSEYVRRRDATDGLVQCCTCRGFHQWKYLDCGHMMSRRYRSVRYDEQNTGPQCKDCNIMNQGKQLEFSIYIDKKYGTGTSAKVLQKSKMMCKRDRYDLEVLIDHYKKKLKELV